MKPTNIWLVACNSHCCFNRYRQIYYDDAQVVLSRQLSSAVFQAFNLQKHNTFYQLNFAPQLENSSQSLKKNNKNTIHNPTVAHLFGRGCTLHTRPETMTEIFEHTNSQAKFPAEWVTEML